MQQASINLTQSLHEVYEPDWHGKDDVLSIGKVRTSLTTFTPTRSFAQTYTSIAECLWTWTRPTN